MCPGTSCVAAATGRSTAFRGNRRHARRNRRVQHNIRPDRELLYESTALGAVTLTDLAGVSRGAGVACVTVMALTGLRSRRMERVRR